MVTAKLFRPWWKCSHRQNQLKTIKYYLFVHPNTYVGQKHISGASTRSALVFMLNSDASGTTITW